MMQLIFNLLALSLGILLYEYFGREDYQSAFRYIYWMSFGGVFIYFKFGLHKQTE